MTNTLTTDIKSTINQIHSLEEAGADIVRVSCPDESSTKALKRDCQRGKSANSCRYSFSLQKSY